MHRQFFAIGSIFGLLAVALGAFAAHGLKDRLTPEMLAIFETGARYQMYHALALLAVALASEKLGAKLPAIAGWLFVFGIAIFSGSLYLLATTGIRWLGAITPIGGMAFVAGWAVLAIAAMKSRSSA